MSAVKPTKIFGVLYDGSDIEDDMIELSEKSQKFYFKLAEVLYRNGIAFMRLPANRYRIGSGSFKSAWLYSLEEGWERVKEVSPDLIWDKLLSFDSAGNAQPQNTNIKLDLAKRSKVFNSYAFNSFLNSKLNQYTAFAEYMPLSRVLPAGEQYRVKEHRIVVKKFVGSGGEDVDILNQGEIAFYDQPVLLQKFVDGRNQDSGNLQDYRLIYFAGKLQLSISRVAQPESLYTNFHQGASVEYLPLSLPIVEELQTFASPIVEKLNLYGNPMFTLDFLKDHHHGNFYLMEVNTMPGMHYYNEKGKRMMDEVTIRFAEMVIGLV